MKKISTLYKKNPENLGLVIDEVNAENNWVFTDDGVKATRKFDGAACAIIEGQLYKRYDVKRGRIAPDGAIECQEPDEITGHHPHWIKCDRNKPEDKYFFEAFHYGNFFVDGTYELCGPKINSNKEHFAEHVLVKHGDIKLDLPLSVFGFENYRSYLQDMPIEGIVFHHPDGRMCKLRKSDFGIKR